MGLLDKIKENYKDSASGGDASDAAKQAAKEQKKQEKAKGKEKKPKKEKKGRGKKQSASAGNAAGSNRPAVKEKKKGLLGSIGIKKEGQRSSADLEKEHRENIMRAVWNYLRSNIDDGARHYFETGQTDMLEPLFSKEVGRELVRHLEELRSAGVRWDYPNRAARAQAKVVVVDEKLVQRGEVVKPTEFTVQEHFMDFSEYRSNAGEDKAHGEQRSIRATIEVVGDSSAYRIIAIEQVAELHA